jgi:DNA polymerase-4
LIGLVDRITRRMRAKGRTGRTVTLRLRFEDWSRATRSRTLPRETSQTDAILTAARALLDEAAPLIAERGITLVGVAVSNLETHGAVQLEFPSGRGSHDALDLAVDEVRGRFGNEALVRAVLLGRRAGFSPPLLPDQ